MVLIGFVEKTSLGSVGVESRVVRRRVSVEDRFPILSTAAGLVVRFHRANRQISHRRSEIGDLCMSHPGGNEDYVSRSGCNRIPSKTIFRRSLQQIKRFLGNVLMLVGFVFRGIGNLGEMDMHFPGTVAPAEKGLIIETHNTERNSKGKVISTEGF